MLKVLVWFGIVGVFGATSTVKKVKIRTAIHATEIVLTYIGFMLWLFG